MALKVRVVFDDWRNETHRSLKGTPEGVELSDNAFHAGTTYIADLYLASDEAQELREAMERGYIPVFYVLPDDE